MDKSMGVGKNEECGTIIQSVGVDMITDQEERRWDMYVSYHRQQV
jgi:hypothetical protein